MDVARAGGGLPVSSVHGEMLPTTKISQLQETRQQQGWLINDLWLASACGIIGGQPKCWKTWLGLDMAISVSSGTPCLGRFEVPDPGPSLIFMAEDRLDEIQSRVHGICQHRGVDMSTLDLSVITAPSLRLDSEADQKRLYATVGEIKPRLLLLDPMVRLHRLDENNARDMSGFLGFLRDLERSFGVSIILTHHAGKRGSSRPGQGLRGSSDLHAYGDSNLYLARHDDEVEVILEHRSAPAIESFRVNLVSSPTEPHLAMIGAGVKQEGGDDLSIRLCEHLKGQPRPMSRTEIRQALRVNNQRLGVAIKDLIASEQIVQDDTGIRLPMPS